MATLTYDPTPADEPELNQAEQEALEIGEKAAAEHQQMLAGKFKDAEALEAAYIELQQKLGEPKDEVSSPNQEEEPASSLQEEQQEEVESTLLADASAEWAEKGELSKETMANLSELSSAELIEAYMELQQSPQNRDLTQDQVASIYKAAGGEETYNALTNWAADSLPKEAVEAYNNVVNSGDPATIQLMLAGIRAAYDEANGREGTMLTGKAVADKVDVFRSQAEVVAAMSDPRYDRDPAYRQDVFAKLERSELQY